MNIEYLQERVEDYKTSIETVVAKKTKWNEFSKPLLLKTLKAIVTKYTIGWKVQELNWIHNNEAVNISFETFPKDLMDCTNKIPTFQFIPGGALIFSQTYSGDIYIFVMFPEVDGIPADNNTVEFGLINPSEVTEKVIIEKVEEFLKEMIQWEVPNKRTKVGYSTS
ncbi:hypothetical protein [Patiriisocius marinus]|uniref:Uncharacterized protein n=1 Tax=Patiriisocius marinus TaxID=1397112 RepID=A0A5J4IYM9_9FLAO|nr:hypothetical protein [Patiriisocius marinus]GER60036.1 hypothetical protein ULMA_21440 [Patiriisocius marinus]